MRGSQIQTIETGTQLLFTTSGLAIPPVSLKTWTSEAWTEDGGGVMVCFAPLEELMTDWLVSFT